MWIVDLVSNMLKWLLAGNEDITYNFNDSLAGWLAGGWLGPHT